MFAVWLFGPLLCLLLFIITLQLRSIRKQLSLQNSQQPTHAVHAVEGELPLEAWLQELEAKGAEVLSKIEQQYDGKTPAAAVDVSVSDVVVARNELKPVSKPRLYAVRQSDEAHVHDWVRKQVTNTVQSNNSRLQWAKARQRIGQDWLEVQSKVHELAERGMPAANIARSLGLSQGEVQLILCKYAMPMQETFAESGAHEIR